MVTRRQKDGTEIELGCPPSVSAYAKYMGGVDKLDQMTRQNKSKKTMKWYRRIESKMLETSLFNAYVIEGHVIDHTNGKRDFLSFKLDLIHQLIGENNVDRPTPGRPRVRDVAMNDNARLDRIDHWPVKGLGTNNRCAVCTARHNDYKRRNPGVSYSDNPHKLKKTTMKCEKCDAYLCCMQSDCFKVYHTHVTFP